MRNFDAFNFDKSRENSVEKKEINLENIENLSPDNYGNFFVIEKDTGKIVNKISTEHLRQNAKGEISILNKDGAIEKYNPQQEYQDIINGKDPAFLAKQNWEKK